jgi:hypothetical protein
MTTSVSKYALEWSVTRDSFALTVDGKAVGPGPAHYKTIEDAFRYAGAWIWIFAEASQRSGGRGHGHEWDTLVFLADGKYGFLTPQPNEERHAAGPNALLNQHRKAHALKDATIVGYLHSHPAGARVAFDTAGEVLSPIDLENECISGDLGVAVGNPQWWIGALTPKAKIIRAKLRPAMLLTLTPHLTFGSCTPLTSTLKKLLRSNRDNLFDWRTDQEIQGAKWKPFEQAFREKCIAQASHELN